MAHRSRKLHVCFNISTVQVISIPLSKQMINDSVMNRSDNAGFEASTSRNKGEEEEQRRKGTLRFSFIHDSGLFTYLFILSSTNRILIFLCKRNITESNPLSLSPALATASHDKDCYSIPFLPSSIVSKVI